MFTHKNIFVWNIKQTIFYRGLNDYFVLICHMVGKKWDDFIFLKKSKFMK